MSLEDSIVQLTEVIEELNTLLTMRTDFLSDTEGIGDPEITVPEEPPTYVPPPESEPQGLSDKAIALINLSKELGYQYLQQGDEVVVDNRVLDEWNRRHRGDNLA